MPDVFTREKRSEIMSLITGKNTKPEKVVRSAVHRLGYRFRIHVKALPGSPDLVLPRHKKVIFVNGCFWHQHPNCNRSKRPASRKRFWNEKLSRNVERDRQNQRALRRLGWKVLVIWECETRKPDKLLGKLTRFLESDN